MPAEICGAKIRQLDPQPPRYPHFDHFESEALPVCQNPPEPGKRRCRAHGGTNPGARTQSGMNAQIRAMVAGRKRWAAFRCSLGIPFPNSRKGCKNRSPEERDLRARIKKARAEARLAREWDDLRTAQDAEGLAHHLVFMLDMYLAQERRRAAEDVVIVHPTKRGHPCLAPPGRRCLWKQGYLCQCDPIGRAKGASLTAALRRAERQSKALG
jgi:hypothetical protein